MAMPAIEPLVAPQRRVGHGLQRSDQRALLVGGDVVALVLAVTVVPGIITVWRLSYIWFVAMGREK